MCILGGDGGERGTELGLERVQGSRGLGAEPRLELGPAGLDRVQIGRVGRQVAMVDPGRGPAPFAPPRPCGRRGCPSPRSASGRSRSAGASTCSTNARNTAVLVAAAMLMHATTPSRARAPITVSRFQCPQGTLPGARSPSGRPGVGPGQPGVDPALVEEDQARRGRPWPARCAKPPGRRRDRRGPAPRPGGFFAHPAPAAAASGTRSARSPARRCARPAGRRTPPRSGRWPPPPGLRNAAERAASEPRRRAAGVRLGLAPALGPAPAAASGRASSRPRRTGRRSAPGSAGRARRRAARMPADPSSTVVASRSSSATPDLNGANQASLPRHSKTALARKSWQTDTIGSPLKPLPSLAPSPPARAWPPSGRDAAATPGPRSRRAGSRHP